MIEEAPEQRITYGKGGGIQSEKVIILGQDEYRSSKYVGDLGDLPGMSNNKDELQARTKKNKNTEISKRKAATTALNALQQLFWSHLCGEDP